MTPLKLSRRRLLQNAGGLIAAAAVPNLGSLAAQTPPPPPAPCSDLPPTVFPPYLQNPAADAMTVCFLAQGMLSVNIDWQADGAASPTVSAAKGLPIPGTPWSIWRFRFTGLKPAAAYQYQVRFRSRFGGAEASTPAYRFRTIAADAVGVRFAVFNDLHHQDKTLAALMAFVKPEDYEFTVLLGDVLEGCPNDEELFRALRAYLPLINAAEKPLLFVRGNHDVRNSFASRLAYLFDLPNLSVTQPWGEDQWQFTLRSGPVWFLAMDTGEDQDGIDSNPATAYKQPEFWHEYRRKQAAWLKQLLATKPAPTAPWRIFLGHIPLYNQVWDSPSSRELWEPILRGTTLDVMLAGHDHQWRLLPKAEAGGPFWPVLIGGGPALGEGTVMLATADAHSLHIRLLAATDGRLLTEFKAAKS
jgi:hypothetical protein